VINGTLSCLTLGLIAGNIIGGALFIAVFAARALSG
jgi:formate/nitrite transporter FocA (FNT family)